MPRPNRGLGYAAPAVSLGRVVAAVALLGLLGAAPPIAAIAASPPAGIEAVPISSPCPRSLKFAGSLYLDIDVSVPAAEVGPQVGETEPNPAQCALPDRLKVFRHSGHNTTDEVVYYLNSQTPELFRSAGQTGFPGSTLVRVLVLILVVGIVLFAALPAMLGHLRQPPVGVGRDDTDWLEDMKAESTPGATAPDRDRP
jgi:hypothetical protein